MSQNYTQCKLVRGNETKVVWIPEEFAKQDKFIQIKDLEKEYKIPINGRILNRIDMWEDGWQVKEIYLTVDEERVIPNAPSNWW